MSEELPVLTESQVKNARLVSGLKLALASAAWIVGAVMVAFPKYLFSFDFRHMFEEFLVPERGHAATLVFLLIADVAIVGGLLNDRKLLANMSGGRRVVVWLGFLCLYIMVTWWVPGQAADIVQANAVLVGLVALLIFGIPRGMAYAPPEQARAMGSH